MTRLLGCVVLTMLLSAGCKSARPDAGRTAETGRQLLRYATACYALFDSGGQPASDSLFGAPGAVRLDTVPVDAFGEPGVYRAVSLDTTGHEMTSRPSQVFAGGVWSLHGSPDTLRLRFHDGFSGTVFNLVPVDKAGDTLTGHAIESFDAGPTTRHDGVRAVRAPCTSGQM